MLKTKIVVLVAFQLFFINLVSQNKPLRIGVVGLTHTHVHWIFNSESNDAFEIVGIVEPNKALAQRYADQYKFSMDMVYDTLGDLIMAKQPQAVTAFGTIYDHLKVVEICAPKGIHVMVEKPLAVNLEHARKMKALADKHKIHLLTNYETTWYPTNHKAYELISQDTIIGDLRKLILRYGHKGPKKIGVNKEFLDWLIDPKYNGGGAITDFGCYGPNILTWLLKGQKPVSVTAITSQYQPENNPKVDDEAIIVLNYDDFIAVVQASWNWPIGRKDMEIYGLKGTIYADNRNNLRIRTSTGYNTFDEVTMTLPERERPFNDPFVYFTEVINGTMEVGTYEPSSLENNMIVMEILDAAIKSSKKNKTIVIQK